MKAWKINHEWGKNREINPSQVPRGVEGVAGHEWGIDDRFLTPRVVDIHAFLICPVYDS